MTDFCLWHKAEHFGDAATRVRSLRLSGRAGGLPSMVVVRVYNGGERATGVYVAPLLSPQPAKLFAGRNSQDLALRWRGKLRISPRVPTQPER